MELGRSVNYDSLMIDLFNFSQSLALDLTINESTQVKYNAKGQLELKFIKKTGTDKDWQDEYFNDFGQNGEYKKLIRSCILLTQKGSNHSFTHKSIQEFYVASYLLKILDEISKVQQNDFEQIIDQCQWEQDKLINSPSDNKSIQLSLQLVSKNCQNLTDELYNKDQFNISTDNFNGVLSLIKEEMKSRQELKDKLIQLVLLSKISTQFIRAASNSIYLLGYNNEYLGKQQLQNIRISNTKLIGMNFYGANLEGSQMENVKIFSGNFDQANLQNVKWTNMECNELPDLEGHSKGVNCVSFSPDQKTLASCSRDNTIKLWDYREGKELATFTGHNSEVFSVAFSPDGLTLASAANNIILWNIQNKTQITIFSNHTAKVTSIQFSPDGMTLASISLDETIGLWDVKQQVLICSLKGRRNQSCIAFSPNGKFLAVGSYEIIQIWDTQQKIELDPFIGHRYSINSIAFSPDGQTILSGDYDTKVRLWNVETRKEIATLQGHFSYILSVAFSPDGLTFASASDDYTITLWDTTARKQITKFIGHTTAVVCVSYSKDGQIIASCGQDKMIRLWDNKAGQEILPSDRHTDSVNCVAFSPEGQRLASCSSDSTIRIWDVYGGQEISVIKGHKGRIQAVQFTPDGQFVVSGGSDSAIRFWNIISGNEEKTLIGHKQSVYCLNFHEQKLASCDFNPKEDKTDIILWNYMDGKQISSFQGQGTIVVAFSPDGLMIAASGERGRLIDASTGNVILKLCRNTYVFSSSFSPDGTLLASSSEDSIDIWDIQTKKLIKTISYRNSDNFGNLSFSPNGQILMSYSELNKQKSIIFYEVSTWVELTKVNSHKVMKSTFSPNGKILACSIDNTIMFWELGLENQESLNNQQCTKYDFTKQKPQCLRIIGRQSSMVAQKCQLEGAHMITKSSWNIQRLFQQKQ